MSCEKFDAFEAGRMAPGEFAEHVRDCAACAALAALNARLDKELEGLREPISAPGLWERIERSLAREKARAGAARGGLPGEGRSLAGWLRARRWLPAAVGAAVSAILILGGVYLLLKKPFSPSGILAHRALAEVELKEKDYVRAIRDLEKQAAPRIEAMDLQLMSLYRDKLGIIDSQIDKCREALESNPANAHIRYCLLAALQDKRQTLTEALGTMNETNQNRRTI
jgi:hypothetical protein